jgi:TldD protein
MLDYDFIRKEIEKYNPDYWDLRYTEKQETGVFLWNRELKQIGEEKFHGIGVRIFQGNNFGFSACSDLSKDKIRETIKKAFKISRLLKTKEKFSFPEVESYKDRKKIVWNKDLREVDIAEKKKFLCDLNYSIGKEIKSVYLKYRDCYEKSIFLSSGSEIIQEFQNVFLAGAVMAVSGENSEEQVFRIAKQGGFEKIEEGDVQSRLDENIKNSLKFLNAEKARQGKTDIVMSGAISGLFAHEALGHASESDLVLQNASCLRGMLGKELAGEEISILDDPTQNNFSQWGAYYYDDEGSRAGKTYIIKHGKLKNFLTNLEAARILKLNLTGNGRAESAFFKPVVRMSNTYFEKGEHSFEELIEEIKEGYYLKGFRGGATDPASGGFQFKAQEAYYVRNGKIVKPVKGVGFGGNTLELLKKIKFTEKEYSEDSPGFCGKAGQRVLAGGKNPSVYVEKPVLI